MKMIMSIDIGTRNFAWALYDDGFKDFGVIDLGKGTNYAEKIKKLQDNGFFDNASKILVEVQMRPCMKILANTIRCFNWDKTIRIAPQSVKRHFSSGTKKHYNNKKKAIELARLKLKGILLTRFEKLKKKDDVADCVMQCIYYLQNY